jgi:hypothetical protein
MMNSKEIEGSNSGLTMVLTRPLEAVSKTTEISVAVAEDQPTVTYRIKFGTLRP